VYCSASWHQHKISNQNTPLVLKIGAVTAETMYKMHIVYLNIKWCISQTQQNFIMFISVSNQLDTQNFCFTISLFHASTCFEHMCSSSGGQNCITQHLVSSHDCCFHSMAVQKSNAPYAWPLKHVQRRRKVDITRSQMSVFQWKIYYVYYCIRATFFDSYRIIFRPF